MSSDLIARNRPRVRIMKCSPSCAYVMDKSSHARLEEEDRSTTLTV